MMGEDEHDLLLRWSDAGRVALRRRPAIFRAALLMLEVAIATELSTDSEEKINETSSPP
jgi:hypothetical protein